VGAARSAMTPRRLLFRSLVYHRGIHLAVALGVAVGAAVLSGALLVGDSVRGSLRDLTLDRLGAIDHALVTERYFREALADDLAEATNFAYAFERAAPALARGAETGWPTRQVRTQWRGAALACSAGHQIEG